MPLLWLSAAFLIGLTAGKYLSLPLWGWFVPAAALVAVSFFEQKLLGRFKRYRTVRNFCAVPIVLLIAFVFIGGGRFSSNIQHSSPEVLAWYNDSGTLRMEGVVTLPPEKRSNYAAMRVKVQKVYLSPTGKGIDVQGDVLVNVFNNSSLKYGDRVMLKGDPKTPSAGFDFSYRDYLARKNVFTVLYFPEVKLLASDQGSVALSLIYSWRASARQKIDELFVQPEAALFSGILLGMDADIPAELWESYRRTGTAHIIAISGYNIAILTGLIFGLFRKLFNRWWSVMIAILVVVFYTLLVGAESSVVRAAIMGSLALIGRQLGRRQAGLNALGITAAVMGFVNPTLPWEASFQLSFTATMGLVTLADPLQNGFTKMVMRRFSEKTARRLSGPVSEYFLFTLAAQIVTMPVIAYQFHQFSLVSLLSNPLVLPVQPIVMVLGGLAVLASFLWFPLGKILAFPAWLCAAYTDKVVTWLGKLPKASISLGNINLWVVIIFFVLFLFAYFTREYWKNIPWIRGFALTGCLLIIAFIIWESALPALDGRVQLKLISDKGKPSLIIKLPDGRSMLLHGGTDSGCIKVQSRSFLAFVDQKIDLLVLTDGSGSSIRELLGMMEGIPVNQISTPRVLPNSKSKDLLERVVSESGIDQAQYFPSQQIKLGNQANLIVLFDEEEGPAFLLETGRAKILIPGHNSVSEIKHHSPLPLEGVTMLILTEKNFVDDELRDWMLFQPVVVVWAGKQPYMGKTPANFWQLIQCSSINMSTDGQKVWFFKD